MSIVAMATLKLDSKITVELSSAHLGSFNEQGCNQRGVLGVKPPPRNKT